MLTTVTLSCRERLNKAFGAQPFNYTDALDALPNSILAFGSRGSLVVTTTSFIGCRSLPGCSLPMDSSGQFTMAPPLLPLDTSTCVVTLPSAFGARLTLIGPSLMPVSSFLPRPPLTCTAGERTLLSPAKLQLNGQDRFSEREGTYFDLVQPYQHHTRTPDTGINVYSFALRPEEHQPSGTCNFSRIDNATLQLRRSLPPIGG